VNDSSEENESEVYGQRVHVRKRKRDEHREHEHFRKRNHDGDRAPIYMIGEIAGGKRKHQLREEEQ